MSRTYDRLAIEIFGRQLITSGDLDPVYIAVDKMAWENEAHRNRWLIAYWCLYHCGAASWLSEHEGDIFWIELLKAAANELPAPTGGRWPRGSERRHWRGAQALASCNALSRRYGSAPEDMVTYIAAPGDENCRFDNLSVRARSHLGFGPWIAFKIGDMIDRLGIAPVDFTDADVFMFADPVMAAKMLYAQRQGFDPQSVRAGTMSVSDSVISPVVAYLEREFQDLMAPPQGDRPIGLQEVETVLCKWKSHLNGHYPLFNDITEILEGVGPWRETCTTAELFHYAMPKIPPAPKKRGR